MKSFHTWYNGKKYRVDLDDQTGEIIGCAVEVFARGKRATERKLWRKDEPKPMPQTVRDVMNMPSTNDAIARWMRRE